MSTTPELTDSEFVAVLAADALINEARQSAGHRRLYLSGLFGLTPNDIFSALCRYMTPKHNIIVRAGNAGVQLNAIPLTTESDGPLLVPYLVTAHGADAGPNQGTAGFAALLRDEVPAGNHPPRVLLVLDQHPVETVRTAAEDAAGLASLSWTALATAAVGGDEPVRSLLTAVLEDDRKSARLEPTARSVGTLRRIATCGSAVEAGASLHLLGCYLADPEAHADRRRLKQSARWRERLEAWSVPGQDLEGRLRRQFRHATASLERVLAARTPFGLDYSQFTLNDVLVRDTATKPLRLSSPLKTTGAVCASQAGRAAIWCRGGGSFAVLLASAAEDDAVAKLTWSDGAADELPIVRGNREISITADGEGWRFATLELPSGYQADMAIFLGSGEWAPFEVNLDIDIASSAFRSSFEPRLLALGPAGDLVGQPYLRQFDDVAEDGEPRVYMAELGTQAQPIVLLVSGTPDQDSNSKDAEVSSGVPDIADRGHGEQNDEAIKDWLEEDEDFATADGIADTAAYSTAPVVHSVAHARLHDSRSGLPSNEPSFIVSSEGVGMILTPELKRLSSQQLRSQVDGLHLEAEILRQPGKTAFVITRSSGGVVLDGHPYLDRLKTDSLPDDLWKSFLSARTALFTALRPYGSVHALATGVAATEAHAYVSAYHQLLDAMLACDRFQAEFERLVLCDAVSEPETGELFLAPTNPVTVRYLLSLTDQIEVWLPHASELLDADVATLTPRHLLPAFALQNTWYETGRAAPLLWRRYLPQSQANAGEHRPGYIARRIKHFLDVHPEYRDERQVLALAFHEPGDGKAVLDALRQLVKLAASASEGPALPQLDVTIISSADAATSLERAVSGTIAGTPTEAALDRLLRDRLTVRRAAPHEHAPEFAHLSFVFRSPLERIQTALDLDSRAGTLYVEGLATSPGRHTQPGRNETTFSWGVFSAGEPVGELQTLIHKTLELVGGMPREPLAQGRTRMPSTRVSRAFLKDLYGSSAWVVHLDKLLGLEAFAPDTAANQAHYLIDYEDRADPAQPGLDAITATARVSSYRLALRQVLTEFGQPTSNSLDRFLKLFNGVSGKWALGLVGANPDQLRERIGLAVAIASVQDLDRSAQPTNAIGVILPLEEVLDALPQRVRPAGQSFHSLLVYLQIPLGQTSVTLRGRLLDVRYKNSTSPAATSAARKQLQDAHSWLHETFGDTEGPSRLFRSRDLSELVRGSATRAAAFGLLPAAGVLARLEVTLDAIACGNFSFDLSFQADGQTLHGDYVSIEDDSATAVHRQILVGTGLPLGHVRLGRPALQALVSGKRLTQPPSFSAVTFPEQDDPPAVAAALSVQPPDPGQASATSPEAAEPPRVANSQPPELPGIAARLDHAFAKYGLSVEPFIPSNAQTGPSIIRFRTRTLGRLSISDVERRARDIGREIAAPGEVQIGDEPGFVTVDVPRAARDTLVLTDILPVLDQQPGRPGALQFAVGMAPSGDVRVSDLSRLPHLLVAGATGSGKSVFLRGLLVELLRKRTPDQLQLMIVDPKRLDFAPIAKAAHVRGGIISDPNDALHVLRSTLETELAHRQPILEEAEVSSAAEFYESGGTLEELPQLVIVVDEFADLVLAGDDRKSFSELIQRYAQLTRAYGIFLVLATQRPSVDVITGSIKANLSARVAFSLPSHRDSMTILDRAGAEDLLGNGDLLFYHNGKVDRLQAPMVTLADVKRELG